jgi:multicomponent Na+:H+ antiporter subunit B
MSTLIARTTTKAVTPIILLTSIAILLQGHNLPGGGFIAGVLTAAGFALLYIMFSIDYLEKDVLNHRRKTIVESFEHSIQEDYEDIISIGLLIAVTTGLVAIFYNLPFLTQDFWIFHWPIYTELHIASAFVFDLGVYAVVVGALLTVLSVVGEQ